MNLKQIEERVKNTAKIKAMTGGYPSQEEIDIADLIAEVKRLQKYEQAIGAPKRRLVDENERQFELIGQQAKEMDRRNGIINKLNAENDRLQKELEAWYLFEKMCEKQFGKGSAELASDLAELAAYRKKGPVDELERVVRCKNCILIGGCISQMIPPAYIDENGFCSHGERREL